MANGNPRESERQGSRFLILRTFSTVKPRKMATFMNATTWQAAWLRHHFHWDRVVVGYALTDIPERVLEIYGIPTNDLESARGILEELHAQDVYQELKECCEGSREQDEVLLPAMQYKTFLRDFMEERMDQFSLAALQREIQGRREENRTLLREVDELQAELAGLQARRSGLQGGLAGNQGGSAGRQGTPDALVERERGAESQAVMALERQIGDFQSRIARLPPGSTLLARDADFEAQLSRVEEDLRAAQANHKRRFEGLRIPNYFLNVAIKLKRDALNAYIDGMTKLLEDFAWDFIAAGEHPPRPAGEPEHEIMHLWRFGDANDLYRQMVELRESKRYSDLTEFFTEQRHMLMCDWEALSRTKRAPPFPERNKEE